MIVDYQRKFVFVHPWKTGGTSIARVLDPKSEARRSRFARFSASAGRSARRMLGLPVLGKHSHALDVRRAIGEDRFSELYSFGFVRNPWDWLVSWYTFVRETNRSPDTGLQWRHHLRADVEGLDFEDFVAWVCRGGLTKSGGRKRSSFAAKPRVLQRDWFSDLDGNIIVTRIGRFETLAQDFAEISERLGIANIALPHDNKSARREYQSYYNDATRDAVGEHFEPDVKLFGYTF